MGSAMIDGWLNSGFTNIHVLDKKSKSNLVNYYKPSDVKQFLASIDLLFVAVRPSSWPEIIPLIKDASITKVSIMAGVTLSQLEIVPGPWFRLMPNLPVSVGQGCLALYSNCAPSAELAKVFAMLGQVITLAKESDMHAFTAIAGSGPAWLWHYMQEWIDAAVAQGFSQEQASAIVQKTIAGTIAITGLQSPKDLCAAVASKGGTTEQGLQVISEGIMAAIAAATQRSKELGQ